MMVSQRKQDAALIVVLAAVPTAFFGGIWVADHADEIQNNVAQISSVISPKR